MTVDVIEGIVTHLSADAAIIALVGSRVYGGILPSAEAIDIPSKCVVVKLSGGATPGFAGRTLTLDVQRIDVNTYGENDFEANRVCRAVYSALKAIERLTVANMLIHWSNPASGALSLVDRDTDWHYCMRSYQVCASEETIP